MAWSGMECFAGLMHFHSFHVIYAADNARYVKSCTIVSFRKRLTTRRHGTTMSLSARCGSPVRVPQVA
jgi:hypothetical protein